MSLEAALENYLNQSPMGKLLTRYHFKPINTESSARRVAEKAAEEIDQLLELVDELDAHEGAEGWSKDLTAKLDAIRAKHGRGPK